MAYKLAVYAGSFDPLTNGHLWMIKQGSALFDRLIVAIGVNPDKHCMFSIEERKEILQKTLIHYHNVVIDSFTNQFLIDYAYTHSAQYILRGIRNTGDFEYERTMRNINSDIKTGIETVYLMPPREIAEVSSSMVKGMVGPEGWQQIVEKYLPVPAFEKIKEVYDERAGSVK